MGIQHFDVMTLGKAKLVDPEKMSYQDSVDIIYDELHKTRKSFIKIGWYLKHIHDNRMYEEEGYGNIYELAKDKFKLSQPTATRFMQVCEEFSINHNSPELDEKYEEFNVSQLFEMLPMQKEQQEQVTADMTIKQIREMKGTGTTEKKTVSQSNILQTDDENNIPGQTNIETDFPECMPEKHSHNDCPSEISSCIRQEWGTSEEQQAIGREECETCWRQWNKIHQNEKGDNAEYTTSHKIEQQICDDNETVIIDGECQEIENSEQEEQHTSYTIQQSQPKLPDFKNNEQRKAWLAAYKEWGLWYRDEHIDVNYYKYDFEDGSRLIVSEYLQRPSAWEKKCHDHYYFHLLNKRNLYGDKGVYDAKYDQNTDSETYLIEFLKVFQRNKKEG